MGVLIQNYLYKAGLHQFNGLPFPLMLQESGFKKF